MLVRQGILRQADGAAIAAGLDQIREEIAEGRFAFSRRLEDIHMNMEARLSELIGEPAGRLHTARSRNDQVATDFRLWVRDAIDGLDAGLVELRRRCSTRRSAHAGDRHAGLHPSAAGPAGHLRPSSAGLCRDARRATAAASPIAAGG